MSHTFGIVFNKDGYIFYPLKVMDLFTLPISCVENSKTILYKKLIA